MKLIDLMEPRTLIINSYNDLL